METVSLLFWRNARIEKKYYWGLQFQRYLESMLIYFEQKRQVWWLEPSFILFLI